MIEYIDSGYGGPDECTGIWLDQQLTDSITSFRGQFGFYDPTAIHKYIPTLTTMVDAGGTLRLVIGSNPGDPPTIEGLEAITQLLRDNTKTSLTLIAYRNALFHPKCLHIVPEGGPAIAMVGSANFTSSGLGRNVEASIILGNAPMTAAAIQRISDSIDHWASCTESGVHQIRDIADITALVELGLVITSSARNRSRAREASTTPAHGRGLRPRGWEPPRRAIAKHSAGDTGRSSRAETQVHGASATRTEQRGRNHSVVHRWAKLLQRSDAQQVAPTTNPTGKLRLGRAKFSINQQTWFREIFFGNENWIEIERGAKKYQEAHCNFNISRHGEAWFSSTLKVDHAAHRVAGQNNVPTVLSWGSLLGAWLRENNQVGNWVTLEKDSEGVYWLSIQESKPDWAP